MIFAHKKKGKKRLTSSCFFDIACFESKRVAKWDKGRGVWSMAAWIGIVILSPSTRWVGIFITFVFIFLLGWIVAPAELEQSSYDSQTRQLKDIKVHYYTGSLLHFCCNLITTYCGFINVRWAFNFVDFVVGPNHEIKCPRITENQTFFPSKIQNPRIQMPSKQPFIVKPRNLMPSKFNETTVALNKSMTIWIKPYMI